jgi:hypothetical protein
MNNRDDTDSRDGAQARITATFKPKDPATFANIVQLGANQPQRLTAIHFALAAAAAIMALWAAVLAFS